MKRASWAVRVALVAAAGWPGGAVGQPAGAGETEYAIVPLAGGDTNIGFGVGALGTMARLEPGREPFAWRLDGTVFVTFKKGPSSPYQDAFLLLTITDLLGSAARLELRPSFTRENNLRYHGLGNASVAQPEEVPARDFYERTHPALLARVRWPIADDLYVVGGVLYTHSLIAYGPESNLARDLRSDDPRVRELLNVDTQHGLNLFEVALQYDSRDNEISPTAGQLHGLKVRVSPWSNDVLPYRYLQVDLNVRAYRRLVTDRLVLAGRLVGDLQLGDVPFYELSRYDEASALGGANGVRGVPGDRYYGKRKLFANLELRTTVVQFSLWASKYALGVNGFFDAGRVWADVTSAPELDGTGWGLKYGLGGGLRLRKGETFVLRADLAWSPDARPVGFYFLAGHAF